MISPVVVMGRGRTRCWVGLFLVVLAGTVAGRAGEPAVSRDDIVRTVQQQAGVCVHLGCGEGDLSAKLAEGGRLVVHGLEAKESLVQAARTALQARGLGGLVTVEQWDATTLPYADNLINVLVAENPGAVSEAEITRVLAPNGTAWIQRKGTWLVVHKSWPKDFDEWTHWRHGADGNMVSRDLVVKAPEGLRWVAGPAQDAGGKQWYYDHVMVTAHGRNFYFTEEGLTARDAFNGSWLWTRRIKASTFQEIGTAVPDIIKKVLAIGTRLSKVKPVAVADRVYVAAEGKLVALDAATGQTVAEFGPVTSPREILVESDTLIVSDGQIIRAFDVTAKTPLWKVELEPERILAADGRLFCKSKNVIASFDLATGSPRWRIEDPQAGPATTCTYHQGVLVLEKSSWRDDPLGCGILVYSAQDGRLLWSKEYRPDMTHRQEARAFFADNLLWLQMRTNAVTGFDPLTGESKKSWPSRGKHCATPVATEHYFIAPECDFTDLVTGARTQAHMFKSACRLPFTPANGLLYSFPVQCECFPMLHGYMGLASATTPAPSTSRPRLEKGPAFGRSSSGPVTAAAPGEWPMYRHDVFRSGSTPAALRDSDLKQSWSVQVAQPLKSALAEDWNENPFVPGMITAPVAAGGVVCVAVPDEHRVAAFDAQSGQPRWSFIAGGRIDTPPTLCQNLCLFGAHDGWVYCVNAADGALAWRFRAAPQDVRIMAYGQMESPWPVPGSVLVENGVACLAAGRHPLSDGGLRVLALQARTGKVVWEKTVNDLAMSNWYSPMLPTKKKVGLDFEPVDLLVKDGEAVSMSRWRFQLPNGDFKLQIESTRYMAPGLTVPRGLWNYGVRQNKSVDPRPPAVFDHTRLHLGTTNDAALLLANGSLVTAKTTGDLTREGRNEALRAPVVHDGLAAAYGRLYAATRDGRLICLE